MIRHVFWVGDRVGQIGRQVGPGCLKASPFGEATTVGTLSVSMIEPSGEAAMMTLTR